MTNNTSTTDIHFIDFENNIFYKEANKFTNINVENYLYYNLY